MNKIIKFLVLLTLFIVTITSLESCVNDKKNELPPPEVKKTLPTMIDRFIERDSIRHQQYIDSTYTHMPDFIFSAVLNDIGTDASPEEIVNTYSIKRESYDISYKRFKKYESLPDSLPKISYPELLSDTIQ